MVYTVGLTVDCTIDSRQTPLIEQVIITMHLHPANVRIDEPFGHKPNASSVLWAARYLVPVGSNLLFSCT